MAKLVWRIPLIGGPYDGTVTVLDGGTLSSSRGEIPPETVGTVKPELFDISKVAEPETQAPVLYYRRREIRAAREVMRALGGQVFVFIAAGEDVGYSTTELVGRRAQRCWQDGEGKLTPFNPNQLIPAEWFTV